MRNAGTWTVLLLNFVAVVLTSSLLLIISGYLHRKKIVIFQCVSDVINLIVNDNGSIRYGGLYTADVFIIVPLTFTGLIVMNGIISIFNSYLMSPIYQPQMQSFDDLYKSKFPIWVHDAGWKDQMVELAQDISNHSGWINQMHLMKPADILKEMSAFNNSGAVPVFYGHAATMLDIQKRLGVKAYHLLSKTIMTKYLLSYRARPDYPFVEAISTIIHRLHCSGLVGKWIGEDYGGIANDVLRHRLKISNEPGVIMESGMETFTVPTAVWCGWIASIIIFVCELMWTKVSSCQRIPVAMD